MRLKKEVNIRIGKNIKKCRNAAGLTQEKLAERLGLTTNHISLIEQGNSGISIETLINICTVLGITSDSILFERDDIPKLDSVVEKIKTLEPADCEKLLDVINLLIKWNQKKS